MSSRVSPGNGRRSWHRRLPHCSPAVNGRRIPAVTVSKPAVSRLPWHLTWRRVTSRRHPFVRAVSPMNATGSPYGVHRVIGQHSLPQPADRLDPTPPCRSTEIEIAVEYLHIDASSLRQLRTEHRGDLGSVRTALLTLVKERGKLHNRVTNSGGILIGKVRTVGVDYPDPPAVGARIATLASLTLTPLRLAELGP